MASGTGGVGSTTAILAQRKAAFLKARQRLGIDGGGVADNRAQASVQAVAPPPKAPASPPVGSTPTAAPVQTQGPSTAPGTATQRDPVMLKQAQDFIQQVQSQGKEVAAPPPDIATAPPVIPPSLTDQIAGVGATGASTYTQAMRIFGGTPTPRQMVIFTAVKTLEGQLGRPPTQNEVLMHVTQPGGANTSGPSPVNLP